MINEPGKGPALQHGGIQDAGCAAEDVSAFCSGLFPAWMQVALEQGVLVSAIMLKVKLYCSVRNNFFSSSLR